MRLISCALLFAAVVFASACGDKKEPASKPADPVAANAAPPVPDVGKVDNVKVNAQGFGSTASEAVAEAMKLAILQVNGAAIDVSSISVKYGLDVAMGKDSVSLRAKDFVEAVKNRSGGVIQNFRLLELQEPSATAGNRFKASIEAEIAKFKPSAEMQKIKIVIGQVRFSNANLPMGDRSVSAAEVGIALRQRISDALVQTGRFAVLDRELSPDIEKELDMISTGQSPSAELAKLSQAASADIVWSGKVSNFAYNRHARQLKTSDRELVSYTGGWAISQKLVNVATRQVMVADSLRGEAPSLAPTTLGSGADSGKVLEDMSDALVSQVVASIVRRTFPVTVVSRDGTNVVLSQGGQTLKEGNRYAVVTMGSELKDPQTGQSLGRVESPCCQLFIERVTPNLSYGRLENVRSNLEQLPAGGLQIREELTIAQGPGNPGTESTASKAPEIISATPAPAPIASAKPPAQKAPVSPPSQQETNAMRDDKW